MPVFPLILQEENRLSTEVKIAEQESAFDMDILKKSDLSPMTCPECHGVMVQIQEGSILRYRCHTGYGFTAGSLLSGIKHALEESLWNAIQALEEIILLAEKAAQTLKDRRNPEAAQAYRNQIIQAELKLRQLRPMVFAE